MLNVACPHCQASNQLTPALAVQSITCTACGAVFSVNEGEAASRADLGILFVHGIGQPARGDTLVRFGDPICRWIRRWADGALQRHEPNPPLETEKQPDYRALVTDAVDASIRQRLSEPEAPPQAKLLVHALDVEGVVHSQTWLLAESRWADSFLTPRFVDLAKWGLQIGPWVNASHVGLRIRRIFKRAADKPSAVLRWLRVAACVPLALGFLLLSVFISVLLLLLVPLILILAIPPIPRFRSFLLHIQGGLASTAGDSYVLLASPIQGAAIKSQVSRDIRWIAPRCKRLAIVAHSQGAAVAIEALRTKVLREFDTVAVFLLTFGSGLNKLEELRRYQTSERWSLWGWGPIIGLTAIVMAFQQLEVINFGAIPMSLDATQISFLMGFGALIWSVASGHSIRAQRFGQNDFEPTQQFGIALQWLDVYTNSDPVPNGPLFDEDRRPDYLESREIHNNGSGWSDHTSYWKNDDAFVNLVMTRLANFAGFPCYWLRSFDRHRLLLARQRRRWRVNCLRVGPFWILSVATLLLLGRMGQLDQIGGDALDTLQALPDWPFIRTVQTWAAAPHSTLLSWLGGAYLLVVVMAGYAFLYGIWKLWERRDIKCLYERSNYGLGYFNFLSCLCLSSLVFAGFFSVGLVYELDNASNEVLVIPLFIAPALNFARSWVSLRQFEAAYSASWAKILVLGFPAAIAVGCAGPYLTPEWLYALVAVVTLAVFLLGWLYDVAIQPLVEKAACLGEPQAALARLGNADLTTM